MDYFLGQIGVFGFNFAPINWAACTGTILPIAQNTALYSLLGTYYGGNGQTTFGLPDVRSRTPIGMGSQTPIGVLGGQENVTLPISQIPSHNHPMNVSNAPAQDSHASGNIFATAQHSGGSTSGYGSGAPNVTLAAQTITSAGGSEPHPNIQPYETVNFCIATSGVYPPRS